MTPTTKPFWQSKTVWVQVLAVLCMLIPAVGSWVAKNPVEFVAVLGAINTLVRFATHGSVSVFQDDESGNAGGKGSGSGGSALLAMIATWGALALAGGPLLTSCAVGIDEEGNYLLKPDPYSIDAVLRHAIRHEDEDAKGGRVSWVYYDPATGKEIPKEDYAAWGIKAGE